MKSEAIDSPLIHGLSGRLMTSSAAFPEADLNERMAAVLVPLVSVHGEWKLLFTRRSDDLVDHKGEVSFPGGAVEQSDKDFVATAIRETWEEIGVPGDKIQIIGSMHAFHTVSGYYLKPIIGVLDWPVIFKNNPNEVARVFCIPLGWLTDQNNWHEIPRALQNGDIIPIIHYDLYDGEQVWGITARITRELLQIINEAPE